MHKSSAGVGAEVVGVDRERLRDDDALPAAILRALEDTYRAFDDLTHEEQQSFASLRVLHRFERAVLLFLEDPTLEHLARLRGQPTKVHPLVWTHESGRRSLVIGTHADEVERMSTEESRALLDRLLERAKTPERVVSRTEGDMP